MKVWSEFVCGESKNIWLQPALSTAEAIDAAVIKCKNVNARPISMFAILNNSSGGPVKREALMKKDSPRVAAKPAAKTAIGARKDTRTPAARAVRSLMDKVTMVYTRVKFFTNSCSLN